MSVDDLHAFFETLEGDESLRQEVIALDAASDEERLAALHALAAREGLEDHRGGLAARERRLRRRGARGR